jgi:hypothetical protein
MRRVLLSLSKVFVIGMFAILAGCATQPPIVTSQVVAPPPVSIPVITPTNLQNMSYTLVAQQTLATFEEAFKTNANSQFYVLDRTNMEIMISNVQELRRYILEQQTTINYLAGVLKLQQTSTAAANGTATTTTTTPTK